MNLVSSVPSLDDRHFQDLVDESKLLVQRRCPEWTDHNVSDPGVTLIETFAYMVDQLIYRLNRVPEHQYLRYLEMMGVDRLPPSAAKVYVTFRLSAPQEEDILIERGVEVATRRHRDVEPVVFATTSNLWIRQVSLDHVLTLANDADQPLSRSGQLSSEAGFPVFSQLPLPGDALLLGLDRAAPSTAVRISIVSDGAGDGVDRLHPPLRWEAMCDDGWRTLVENDPQNPDETGIDDLTGGLNDSADITLHLPDDHAEVELFGATAGWIRCVVDDQQPGRPPYTATPSLISIEVASIGGTVTAVHGEDLDGEIVGVSDGMPGQRFPLSHAPVVRSEEPLVVEVSSRDGWLDWVEVTGFSESGGEDRHWRLDAHSGEVIFGPAIRTEDGTLRHFGAIPPVDSRLRIRRYRFGGGTSGNVARGAVVTLRSALPFVAEVTNRNPARGGLDAETAENAKHRGPLVLGTRDRAVTLADYEYLTARASGKVARARAIEVNEAGEPASEADGVGVKVLVVPSVGSYEETGEFRFQQLVPGVDLLDEIQAFLAERRMVGARVMVGPSRYRGVSIAAEVHLNATTDSSTCQLACLRALYRYLSPINGGTEGTGWTYGRPLHVGEIYGVLQSVEGVRYVEGARLFPVNPLTGEAQEAVDRMELAADSLLFGRGHRVQTIAGEG